MLRYEELAPLAKAVADGGRATVLAYGQTGSGKTYTMLGMQRLAVQQVLDGLAKQQQPPSVRLSVVEVHNDKLLDLLDDDEKKLEMRQGERPAYLAHGAPSAEAPWLE